MKNEIEMYLEWKKGYFQNINSFRSYRLWTERFYEFTCKKIEKVTLSDVSLFIEDLRGKYAPKNIEYGMNIVKNIFTFFKAQNYNCLAPVLIKVPRCRGETKRPATREIFEQILEALPTNEFISLRTHCIIRILWETGCRISEVLSIDFKHLDENSALVPTRKTKNYRAIYWSDETKKTLFEKYIPIRICLTDKTDALFIGKHGEEDARQRLTPRMVQREVRRVCEELDIEGITPHSFRHGKAHDLIDKGADVSLIAHILGHTNPTSTFNYLRMSISEIGRRAKKYLV